MNFLNRIRAILVLTLVLVFFLFFIGIIDTPVYNKSIKGRFDRCVSYVSQRYNYGGETVCTAILENGVLVRFTSNTILKSGQLVIYGEFKRPITGLCSYARMLRDNR